jgi:hypothetical protein
MLSIDDGKFLRSPKDVKGLQLRKLLGSRLRYEL